MKFLALSCAAWLVVASIDPAHAQLVLYSQDFETAEPSMEVVPLATYGVVQSVGGSGWQVQGGSGGTGISFETGIDSNGVGGSQALYANWNQLQATSYVYSNYTVYGYPGPLPNMSLSLVRVSMDILISGARGNTPIDVLYQFPGYDSMGNPLLDNMGNQVYQQRAYRPTLADGQYRHVSFTLAQATGPVPNFNFVTNFNLQVAHGNAGFLFDANNVVRIDNVVVEELAENADFDADGDVDGADLLRWQRGLGGTPITWTNGDANGDGSINSTDLAAWKTQFGTPSAATIAAVAEPASLAASVVLVAAAVFARRRTPGT